MIARNNDANRAPGSAETDAPPILRGRLLTLALAIGFAMSVFGLRIYHLTGKRGHEFYELSEGNFLKTSPIVAPRGKIFAGGEVVALNRPLYQIEMSRYRMKPEEVEATIRGLAEILSRPELVDRVDEVQDSRPSWKRVALARNLDSSAVAPVLERLHGLPGLIVEPDYVRHYPSPEAFAHVTGYVGRLTEGQYDVLTERGYLRTDIIGKIGVESRFESVLRGQYGSRLTLRDAQGRLRSSFVQRAATRGSDVYLTIEPRLQRLADELLRGHSGVAIVMNPNSGAILALASKPGFDPNNPMLGAAKGFSSSFNKATRGVYAPGSTFKVVTAAAGLRAGFDPEVEFNCDGRFYLPNVKRPFFCDKRSGHGPLDLRGAIQRSCNVFFYEWAHRLGSQALIAMSRDFGFGQATGFDLFSGSREPVGTLGRSETSAPFKGSVIQMGIGQGALITATPLQIIVSYAALANGGDVWRPYLLAEVRSPRGPWPAKPPPEPARRLDLSREYIDIIRDGLWRAVHERYGTSYARGFKKEWQVAGKTGSSEVAGQRRTNGLFIGFAPFEAPQVIALAIVEAEGHGSTTALPIVLELISEFLEPGSGGRPELREVTDAAANGASVPASDAPDNRAPPPSVRVALR